MHLAFTKMHGLGNDFLVCEVPRNAPLPSATQWRQLADRHAGVGFDQALVIEPAHTASTMAYYRVFNADGGEVEQCGNGARCVARYVHSRGLSAPGGGAEGGATDHIEAAGALQLGSKSGPIAARILKDGRVAVNLGIPDFQPGALPFTAAARAAKYSLPLAGEVIEFGAVSIGNPHAVLRVTAVASAAVESVGRALQSHPDFPKQVNVGFMEILDAGRIRLRVYERGVGETLACGTGACAAVAVGRNLGLLAANVEVRVPGGTLSVHWEGVEQPIWLIGPAEVAFTGQVDL